MTAIDRYEPYVTDVVQRFGNDTRVAWIEDYNEPRAPNADFVFALRDAAFTWASALQPTAPLISCWDDNNATEVCWWIWMGGQPSVVRAGIKHREDGDQASQGRPRVARAAAMFVPAPLHTL